jgi:hypothetical protein
MDSPFLQIRENRIISEIAEIGTTLQREDVAAYAEFRAKVLTILPETEDKEKLKRTDIGDRVSMDKRTDDEVKQARERILATARPARLLPYGKTLEDVIVGALPDDESDEEINTALDELS